MEVRPYLPADYDAVKSLYQNEDTYGGVFDEERDSEQRLTERITEDPQSILVATENGQLVGTVSLIEDKRVAWLYRFATQNKEAASMLNERVCRILAERGHSEVIVYSDPNNSDLSDRYKGLGFETGKAYQAFWKAI